MDLPEIGGTKMEHDNKPIVETQISKSKDGKYLLHVTKITDIKPIGYYAKVLGNEVSGTPKNH